MWHTGSPSLIIPTLQWRNASQAELFCRLCWTPPNTFPQSNMSSVNFLISIPFVCPKNYRFGLHLWIIFQLDPNCFAWEDCSPPQFQQRTFLIYFSLRSLFSFTCLFFGVCLCLYYKFMWSWWTSMHFFSLLPGNHVSSSMINVWETLSKPEMEFNLISFKA